MGRDKRCALEDCQRPFRCAGKRIYCSRPCALAATNRRQAETYKGLGRETRRILNGLGRDRVPGPNDPAKLVEHSLRLPARRGP